jgi:uncharacterized membrane protein
MNNRLCLLLLLLFLVTLTIVNTLFNSLLDGDYVLIKKIYTGDDSVELLKLEFKQNNLYLDNISYSKYSREKISKKFYAILENKKTCHIDIKNTLMIKNFMNQMEKYDVKYYVKITTMESLQSSNILVCSKPETYLELYFNIVFTKIIILIMSFGIYVVILIIIVTSKEYAEAFGFIKKNNHTKTTKSQDELENIV